MKENPILFELCALFDSAADKPCPVLATDTMTVPATFIRIVGAEKSGSGLKVIFELRHRYRDTDPSHAVAAVGYLERLCLAAEATGKATLLSLSGAGGTDSSVGECSARLEYFVFGQLSVRAGAAELSSVVKRITLEEKGIVRESRYFYGAEPALRRVGGRICVRLECTGAAMSSLLQAFGTDTVDLEFSIGGCAFRGLFVLGELNADGDVCAELLSSGAVEHGRIDEKGDFIPFKEGGAL